MHAIASYRANRVATASPLQLVVMLYQELLRRVELGAVALEEGSTDSIVHFHHAREVLTELSAALDPSAGAPELVARLEALYGWSAAELVAAGRDKDAGRARRVARALQPLLEGWTAVLHGAGQ
ncbi:MAG: flagellar export chaperone FliS [Myxococcota bacterium]